MKVSELRKGYYQFGNKGAVWSDATHIAKSGAVTGKTLCGTPMLSHNHAANEMHKTIGCPDCLEIYDSLEEEDRMQAIEELRAADQEEVDRKEALDQLIASAKYCTSEQLKEIRRLIQFFKRKHE